MAKKQNVELIDDIDGSPATETLRYAWSEVVYEVDLSKVHADEFRDAVAPYLSVSRRTSALSSRKGASAKALPPQTTRSRAALSEVASSEVAAQPDPNSEAPGLEAVTSATASPTNGAITVAVAKGAPSAETTARPAPKAPVRKVAARKTLSDRLSTEDAPAKLVAAPKPAARKAPAKKVTAKKVTAPKPAGRKIAAKKVAVPKPAGRKAPATKTT